MTPLRVLPLVFGLTATTTLPGPVPDALPTNVIHESLTCAVQLQPAAVVTDTVTVPPVAGTLMFWLEEPANEMAYVHASAASLTVNVWPATVRVADRAAPSLAATAYATVPLPVPDVPAGRVYRRDLDATHLPMFHQLEALVVDEGGLVVGLNGTGDTLNNIPFTKQSLQAMLERMGVNIRGATIRTGLLCSRHSR